MDELIAEVAQRTGLPADKARAAVEAVIAQLKQRLPGPIASELDALVQGGGAQLSGGLGGLAGELGGLFGKK